MAVHAEDVAIAKSKNALWSEETIMVTATQKRFAPGGSVITPGTIIATDKRVIIINNPIFGIRKEYEAIPYTRIASVRLEQGIISSSVFLHLISTGAPGDQTFLKQGEQDGEIPGLGHDDAKALSDFIQKIVIGLKPKEVDLASDQTPKVQDIEAQTQAEANVIKDIEGSKKETNDVGPNYVLCGVCGAKNDIGNKSCTECGTPMATK